jgi:MFS family permease
MAESRDLIWRYYLYQTTNSAGFYLPISILYLQHRGFGLAFVALTQATFTVAMVAAEIPTGYLGDRLGRRGSLAAGHVLRGLAMGAYAFADAQLIFLALQVVWASGWAFRTGTRDAWLYEVLTARFDASEYARIEGRGSTAHLATSGVAAVIGGVLYGVNPASPFVVNAVLAGAGIPLLFTFPAVGPRADSENADSSDADSPGADSPNPDSSDADSPDASDADDRSPFTVREAIQTLRLQVSRPEVRWLVAYAALFQGLFSVTRTFEQPALQAVGLPVAGLGVIYVGFKLVSAGAAATAGWFEERLGTRAVFALLAPVYGWPTPASRSPRSCWSPSSS